MEQTPVVDFDGLSLGARLKVRRVAAGLTQAQAAQAAGVAQEDVSRIENGRLLPRVAERYEKALPRLRVSAG